MSGDYNKSTDGITFSAFQTKNIIFSVYGASSGGAVVAVTGSGQKMLSAMAF
jgi:hypothetical protein